jgi:Kef-type K+ transport system membrane component KefB
MEGLYTSSLYGTNESKEAGSSNHSDTTLGCYIGYGHLFGGGCDWLPAALEKVIQADLQEACIAFILCVLLGNSFLTEGLGLSNMLGAFLTGALLAESLHQELIEKETNPPIHGISVGIFFLTVLGFEINLDLIGSKLPLISSLVIGLVVLKSVICFGLTKSFGIDLPTVQLAQLVSS